MWVALRAVQVLLVLAAITLSILFIPSGWGRSSSKLAFCGIAAPFVVAMFALEGPIKRSRRKSLGRGLEADGFTVYPNSSDAGVYNQLSSLRKHGFHGLCAVTGLRESSGELQIAAEYDRVEGSGKSECTVYYSIVAVQCSDRWAPIVLYRWSWMNWERGTPFLRKRPAWMSGLFRYRMVAEPVDAPQPEFLTRSLRSWLWRTPWWRREHWSVEGGSLLYCRRGRLTRAHVRQMLRRCERFKELAARQEW